MTSVQELHKQDFLLITQSPAQIIQEAIRDSPIWVSRSLLSAWIMQSFFLPLNWMLFEDNKESPCLTVFPGLNSRDQANIFFFNEMVYLE
jgi:hypothetical protein